MARQWFIPSGVMTLSAVMIEEDGEEEYFIPALGMFNEDQAAAAGGRVMSSLAGAGGLAGSGGIAGSGGGLAG